MKLIKKIAILLVAMVAMALIATPAFADSVYGLGSCNSWGSYWFYLYPSGWWHHFFRLCWSPYYGYFFDYLNLRF